MLDALENILSDLRTGYNPNYQDMAVLEAVRGWERAAGLPHVNDVKKDESDSEETPLDDQHEISCEETERQVESILKMNHVSLLVEHDQFVEQSQTASTRELIIIRLVSSAH
jgi:protein kinase C substrate 80K-H